MIISRKQTFIYLNYIYITGLLVSITNLPLDNVASKFKIIFILFCIIDLLYDRNFKWNKKVAFIALTLNIYVMLWGTIFVNDIVAEETRNHCILMIYYLLLLFLSYYEISKYQCIWEYILSSYYACITVLFIQFILNINQMVKNPFYIFKAVFSVDRVRSDFGFMHTNYVGNICFVALILSCFLFSNFAIKDIFKNKKTVLWLIADILCYFMLISTSSRSAILSLAVFVFIMLTSKFVTQIHLSKSQKKLFLGMSIIIFIGIYLILTKTGLLNYIWINSNREMNTSVNLPFVKQIGNIWTGMGFVENGAFQTVWTLEKARISAFGVATSSLDMYYVYLFCTSGILGVMIVGGILSYILIVILKSEKLQTKNIYLAMYISILFYAFWESVIFSYRFWSMLILMVLVICAVAGIEQKEKRK